MENEVVAVVEEVGEVAKEVGEVALMLLEINVESLRVMNKFPTRPMKGNSKSIIPEYTVV